MILILGGTAEARALAAELVARDIPVVSSLAGRVLNPALPAGEVRVGGFGGVDGLKEYLTESAITAVVDATHPFAARISANAAAAAGSIGVPLVRLARPGWRDHPDAGSWTWVSSIVEVMASGNGCRRPFLTTGRQGLAEFLPWRDRFVLARVVDPPEFELPPGWELLRSRGPYDYNSEVALLRSHRADLLVSKESGGVHTSAKLDAAADLGVPVIMIARPAAAEEVPTVATVQAALDWVSEPA